MRFITPIYLITIHTTTDNLGDQVENISERKILSHKASIGQKEFYEAHTSGMKPEIKLVIRAIEYKGETRLKHNGTIYNITRTYDQQNGVLELICSRGVNHGITT